MYKRPKNKPGFYGGDIGTGLGNDIGMGTKNLIDKGVDKLVDTFVPPPSNPTPANMKQHQINQNKMQGKIDNVTRPVKDYMGVAAPSHGRGGYYPLQQLQNRITHSPYAPLIGKRPVASLLAEKAALLMPYINDNYATETNETKLNLALSAAYELLNDTEPKKTPGGGGAKRTVNAEQIFDKIKPEAWQSWIKTLATGKPYLISIANNKNKSLALAKKMACGNYNGHKGPQFEAPLSLFGRLPKSIKAHDKLEPYFNNYINKATNFIKQSNISVMDVPPAAPMQDKSPKYTSVQESSIPPAKQHLIDQLVNQLNMPSDNSDKTILLEQLHNVTPHLDDNQRKQLLPPELYSLYDNVISGQNDNTPEFSNEDTIDDADIMAEANAKNLIVVQNLLKKINSSRNNKQPPNLQNVTANLSHDEFELSVEALLDMGYSEDAIMAEAERRFSK